jgi:hypothetical protein
MVNDIRFASEYGVHSFLEFYNQRHPGVMAQLLHERGLSKLNAIAAIKDATAVMSYAFFDWIEGDRFYVDVCDGAIDDLWNTVSAHHVETTAPTDEESVLFDIPEWCKWSNEKLVEHWLKQKGEAA